MATIKRSIGRGVALPGKAKPGRGGKFRVFGIESHWDHVRFASEQIKADITKVVTAATLSRTIEGASTVTVTCSDPSRRLLRSAILEQKVTMRLDHLGFVLVAVNKAGRILTLTFEDEIVNRLRGVVGAKKAYRATTTRAEFILSEVREAKGKKIPFFSPQLHDTQKVEAAEANPTDGPTNVNNDDGASSSGATVNINHLWEEHHAPDFGGPTLPLWMWACLAEAAGDYLGIDVPGWAAAQVTIGESGSRPGSSGTDAATTGGLVTKGYGPWAATTNVGNESLVNRYGGFEAQLNPVLAAAVFAEMYKGAGNSLTPWHGSQHVTDPNRHYDGNAKPEQFLGGDSFGEALKKALATAGVAGGGPDEAGGGSTTTTTVQPYAFKRSKKEDAWTNAQRLASEVNWRCFVVAGWVFYISEPRLLDQPIRLLATEKAEGIDAIDFDYDVGKVVTEVTITARAKHWSAPPGTAIELDDAGPANGTYLVSTIDSSLFGSKAVTITCKKPTKPLKEPAPETTTTTVQSSSGGDGSADAGASSSGLDGVTIGNNDAPGSPFWGGTRPVFHQFIDPFLAKFGIKPGATKEFGHDPDGDHPPTATTSYACDYPTYEGQDPAQKLADAMGGAGYQYNTYNTGTIEVDGHSFRVQILNGPAVDHADHIHVGLRAA